MNQELKIIVRADGTAQVVSQLNTVNASMAGTTAKSATMASTMSTQFGKIASSLGLAALGFAAFRKGISIFNESIEQARQAEIAINKLNNAIDNSAISAQITSLEMRNMATELQRISNFGDEDILNNVTDSLLKFRSIGNDVFGRAQKNVIDLAEAMGGGTGSLAGAARMVGMALEDPILGLTKLRRAHIMFTPAQQETIKILAETGRTAEAQTVILSALEQNFKGAATAGINSAKQLKNAWGDYLENAGNGFNSFVTSMNVGMTSYLYTQTASAEATSEIINKALAQNRIRQANFMSGLLITGKSILLTIGMTSISVFGIITDACDAVYRSISNVKTMTLSVFNGLGNIAPRIMEAITGVSSFKDALGDLRNDFTEGISKDGFGLDGFGNATKKNIEYIKTFYNEVKKNIEDVAAFNENTINASFAKIKVPELDLGAFDNIGAEGQADNVIKANIDSILSMIAQFGLDEIGLVKYKYDQLDKELQAYYGKNYIEKSGYIQNSMALDKLETAEIKKLQNEKIRKALDYYQEISQLDQTDTQRQFNKYEIMRSQIQKYYDAGLLSASEYAFAVKTIDNKIVLDRAEITATELEATRKLNNDKLSAQLAYLQATQPLEQSRIDAQLAIYAHELEAYQALGLSKYETDQMFTAKRTELEKANNEQRIADWKEKNELFASITDAMASSFESSMLRMVQIETNSNNEIIKSMVAMVNVLISEVTRYIAKLAIAAFWKAIVLGISGGVGAAGAGAAGAGAAGAGAAGAGAGDLPSTFLPVMGGGALTSTGGGYIPTSSVVNNNIYPVAAKSNDREYLMAVNDNISGLREDLATVGLRLNDSDGTPLMKFVKKAETAYRAL